MNKRHGLVLLAVFVSLAVLAFPTAAQAQEEPETVPCCEGGARPNKKCATDDDCPGSCSGGFRDGKPCAGVGCPNACVGGADAGLQCRADAECRPACVGGTRDGKICDDTQGAPCPGGTCSDTGTCDDIGECVTGTCTGECELRKGRKSPRNPTSTGFEPPVCSALDDDADEEVPAAGR